MQDVARCPGPLWSGLWSLQVAQSIAQPAEPLRGSLKLDELITRRYALDDVNEAYADMRSGVNIRGAVGLIPAG